MVSTSPPCRPLLLLSHTYAISTKALANVKDLTVLLRVESLLPWLVDRGSWLASLMSGFLADGLGRKRAIMIGSVIWVIGCSTSRQLAAGIAVHHANLPDP